MHGHWLAGWQRNHFSTAGSMLLRKAGTIVYQLHETMLKNEKCGAHLFWLTASGYELSIAVLTICGHFHP